jgi:hypothetical protein
MKMKNWGEIPQLEAREKCDMRRYEKAYRPETPHIYALYGRDQYDASTLDLFASNANQLV